MTTARDLTAATSDAGETERQDALLARIETDDLLPGWAWSAMLDTVARLRNLPDGYAYVATRYLQQVARRGHEMFGDRTHHQAAMFAEAEAPTIRCRCGAGAKADRPTRRRGIEITVAVCDACGIAQVMFDGEPYDGPTLITATMT